MRDECQWVQAHAYVPCSYRDSLQRRVQAGGREGQWADRMLMRCEGKDGGGADWGDVWSDFLVHARTVYGGEHGGDGNTREEPSGATDAHLRWECERVLTSYPGEPITSTTDGVTTRKMRPSLKPGTAKDVQRNEELPPSTRATVLAAEGRVQREADLLGKADAAEQDGEHEQAAALRAVAAKQVPAARPHTLTHWHPDGPGASGGGIFTDAVGCEPGYSIMRSEQGQAVRYDPVARAWLRYDELEYRTRPGLKLADGSHLKLDTQERLIMEKGVADIDARTYRVAATLHMRHRFQHFWAVDGSKASLERGGGGVRCMARPAAGGAPGASGAGRRAGGCGEVGGDGREPAGGV